MSGLDEYARALGAAQQLVPDFRAGQMADAQLQAQRFANARNMQVAQWQQQDREAGIAAQAALKSDIAALGDNPTPQAYRRFAISHPELHAQLKDAANGLDADQRQSMVRRLAPVQALIASKRYDQAAADIKRHIDADVAAGLKPDEDDQQAYDMLTSGDPKSQQAAGGMIYGLLTSLDPESAASNITKQQDAAAQQMKGQVVGRAIGHYDQDGQWVTDYRDPQDPEYRTIANGDGSSSIVQVGGGDPASSGAGGAGSGPVSGRTQYGWTPRARNGGDNTDAAVDGKLAGMTKALGISVDTPFPPGTDPAAIYEALTLSEGGRGSLADRNNNRGNLTDGRGGYRQFRSKQQGDAAGIAQVRRNLARGQNTIRKMVEGLPVGGGARQSSGGGSRVVFTSKPTDANPVDQATVDFYAQKVAAGGDLPALGSGKESAAWRRAILSRAADIQNGRGISGGESNLAQADVKANRSALLQAQKQYTATVGFEQTFQSNVQQVLRLAPRGVGGSAPIFNRWIQAGRKNVSGDPQVSAFNVAINTAANEYAKLASGASGGAVTSDSARHEAMEILNNAQTLPQLQAAVRQMQIDGHNRVKALDAQIARLRGNISGAGGRAAQGGGFRILSRRPK